MERIEAMIRAVPLRAFVSAWVWVWRWVWTFVFAVGVAEAQHGGADAVPETGIAPRVTVQGGEAGAVPETGIAPRVTVQGGEAGAVPETGIAPRVTVVQGGDDASEHAHEGHEMAAAPGFGNPLDDIVVAFELVDRDGRTVTAADFRGCHVLLGFGFTHCPDVCPLMALNMGEAVRDTGAVGIFISVDTERDTPEITGRYASRFGERMIGLSGNVSQINAAANNFRVSYAVTKTQNNYTVQHSANVFLIDPGGRLVDVFNFSTPGEELVAAIRQGG